MKRTMTRVTSLVLAMLMIFSTFAGAVSVSDFSDFPSDWSTEAMTFAVENGLLQGYENNTIAPSKHMTRAEMATVLNRAFKAWKQADISNFTDVSVNDWFYSEVSKAIAFETFKGTGSSTFNPNGNITRAQAFTAISRALKLNAADASVLDMFSDASDIPDWAAADLAAMAKAGYVKGSTSGALNPNAPLTRAEFAQAMYNIIKYFATSDTIETVSGNVMIATNGLTLQNVTIDGDLIVGANVTKLTLKKVKINGRLLVRDQYDLTLNITKSTVAGGLVVYSPDEVTTVYTDTVAALKANLLDYTTTIFPEQSGGNMSTGSGGGGGGGQPSVKYYSITAATAANGSISVDPKTAAPGTVVTVTATPDAGYELDKIYVNGHAIAGTSFESLAENMIVSATFKAIDYTVNVVDPANGSLSADVTTANVGDTVTVTATPDSGYQLVAIKVNGNAITGNTFIMPAGNVTITAEFSLLPANTYSITIGAVTNGSVVVSENAAEEGETITVVATPSFGYELVAIKVDGVAITGNTFTMPAKNVVVTAEFKEKAAASYAITVGAVSNGQIVADKTSAKAGETVTVTATPDAGYQLVAIKVNNKAISGTSFAMPHEDVTITAEFAKANYVITITDSDHGTLVADRRMAAYNETVTLTATPNTGYQLAAIKVNGLPIVGTTFTMPEGDVTVAAEFTKVNYEIEVIAPANGTLNANKTTANYNDTITVSATANPGYELSVIKVNGVAITGNTFKMPAGKATVTAEFFAKSYAINAAKPANGELRVNKTSATIGTTVTVTAVPDAGYELVAIKVNGSAITGNTFEMPAGEVTVTAEFAAINYKVTVDAPRNGTVTASQNTNVHVGDLVAITATPDDGFKLDYITVDGAIIAGNTFIMPAKNVTVSASFSALAPNTYSVNVGPVSNGSVIVDKTSAAEGTVITVTATPNAGYKLSTIKVNGSAITGNTFTMPAATVTVTAEFTAIEYAITVIDPANGSLSADLTKASIGTTVTVTATPDAGYQLAVIKVNGVAIIGNTFTMPAEAVEITAEFTKTPYTITVIDPSNGSVSVDKTVAVIGETVTVTTTPDVGYELVAIKVNGTKISGNTFTMIADDVEVTAEFRAIEYNVKVLDSANGQISVDKIKATIGETVTVTATPDAGYVLSVIKVDGKAISGNTFQMKAADVEVTAEFVLDDFSITVVDPANGTLSVNPTTANVGATITVTATPDAGYKLSAIKVNGVAITGNTFTMPASDVEVTAEFELLPPNEYSISVGEVRNGTVSADKTSATEGTVITVTATPAKHYMLDKIQVNGTNIIGNTFTMPAENVVVTATFKEIPYAIRVDIQDAPKDQLEMIVDTFYDHDDDLFELARKMLFELYGGYGQSGGLIKRAYDLGMEKANEKGYLIDGRIPKVEVEDVRTYEVNIFLHIDADTDIDSNELSGDLADLLEPSVYESLSDAEKADVLLEMEAEAKARMKNMTADEKRDWLLDRLPDHYTDDTFTVLLLNRLPDDALNDAFDAAIDGIPDSNFSLQHETGSTHYNIHLSYNLDVNAFVDGYFTNLLENEIIADCRDGMKNMTADEKREWMLSKVPARAMDKAPEKAIEAAKKALNKIPDADLHEVFNTGVDLVPDESFTIEHIPGDTHYTITMKWLADPIVVADAYYLNTYLKNRALDKLAEYGLTPTDEEWALYDRMLPSKFAKDMGDYHQLLTLQEYYEDAYEIIDLAEAAFDARNYDEYLKKIDKAIDKGIPKALEKAREKGLVIVDQDGNDITAEQCIAAAKALVRNPHMTVNELIDIFGDEAVTISGEARGYTATVEISRIDISKL